MNIIVKPTVVNNYRSPFRTQHFDLADYPCKKKLDEAIAVAEGRARVRTINSLDVLRSLDRIERELSIPKKSMEGIITSAIK